MSTGSKHLDAAKASTLRAWATFGLYTAAGVVLDLQGAAQGYYGMGLAVVGLWAAGGEPLITSLSTLRHIGEGYAKGRAERP